MNHHDNNKVLDLITDVTETVKVLWWKFFDWLAVKSWAYLLIIAPLALIAFGMIGLGGPVFLLIIVSIIVKILAGGKRRAEIAATAAATRADVEALERRLLEAEMAALQAQIEPHFLFNTLALIGQLIETNPAEASKVHQHLIKYLRSALPQMRDKGNGKLGQQMEMCRAYLNIMQARMQERLTYQIELPAELEFLPFPSMMIQTLVENSIKHGLEPKTTGGHICVTAQKMDEQLRVEVIDNGMGFNLHADDGLGLSNIRERLKVLYAGKAQLIIEAPQSGGSMVAIQIPLDLKAG
ncbi:histidine kinase [Undibacterium sp. CY18W]|uniref:Histidine kinase n=1 Tax=Undibacterium hunanense TaxID=2762292 RepID=A0ABR6ZKZ4_9BURK|nr:histidine kinase [Undibacterium hunanense]MBC3916576.1 histidine kinase [Undibacterium hunanense]